MSTSAASHVVAVAKAGIVGIAVIGQSPRPDIADLFAAAAPTGGKVVLLGCLDGLSDAEIDRLTPTDGDDTLYTRLPSGRDVALSKAAVTARAPATLAKRRAAGATAIVFNCTGEFSPMPDHAGVVFPSRVLACLVASLLPEGRLGIMVPFAEQASKLKQKWARPGVDVVAVALLPSAGEAETVRAAERLAALQPDFVAMDCMSYGPAHKRIVAAVTGKPTLLGNAATCHVLQAILE